MQPALDIRHISKDFVFHHQNGLRIKVLDDFSMKFFPGQASVLTGESGSGKSTLLRMIYAGYSTSTGRILVRHKGEYVDIATARPQLIYEIRRCTIGYVSQFLRVVPRVSALDTVRAPLLARNIDEKKAGIRARELLERLNIPRELWHLSATTFSGGEQQRINLARGFAAPYPVMLLDEPTASLDPENRETVVELIMEAKQNNACLIGIFHNKSDQDKISDHTINMFKKNKNRR